MRRRSLFFTNTLSYLKQPSNVTCRRLVTESWVWTLLQWCFIVPASVEDHGPTLIHQRHSVSCLQVAVLVVKISHDNLTFPTYKCSFSFTFAVINRNSNFICLNPFTAGGAKRRPPGRPRMSPSGDI